MFDSNGKLIDLFDVAFECGHIAKIADLGSLPAKCHMVMWLSTGPCPACRELDERAAKEEVIRRMELGLGIGG